MRTLQPAPAALASLAILCLVLAGCGGHDTPAATPGARPTSIAELHSSTMRVVRVAFCDLVPKSAVRAALGAAPTRVRGWHDGDPLPGAGGPGHEFGCAWFGPRGRVARAWVFARPVTPAFARTVIRAAGRESGCDTTTTHGFGAPSMVQSCRHRGEPLRIRRAGLFGETWLSCEVSANDKAVRLRARTATWCVTVATSLDAGRVTPGAENS